jgi:hypothetical protein
MVVKEITYKSALHQLNRGGLPYHFDLNDEVILEQLAQWAAEAEVSYMLSGILYLTGGIKGRYLSFIKEYYQDIYKSDR